MFELIIALSISIFALMGHGARKRKALEMIVRGIIVLFFLGEGITIYFNDGLMPEWSTNVLAALCIATGTLLLLPVRKIYHYFFTILDGFASLRFLTGPFRHHMTLLASLNSKSLFIPESIPHMVGLFVFLTTLGHFLQNTNPLGFDFPSIPFPLPISLMQLFTYNGLGLVMVSFCGVGIFVTRNWREAFSRLGWEKPKASHIGIGLSLVIFCFAFDLIWSLYTHSLAGQDLATKLSSYNSGTFTAGDQFGTAVVIALATAIFAGIGEETLIRGALQPVVGIVPAAILHGVLHAQFANSPIMIVQVALWSICFGIVRRFTNTTTTIIGHAGYNFVTTFLFAFNP